MGKSKPRLTLADLDELRRIKSEHQASYARPAEEAPAEKAVRGLPDNYIPSETELLRYKEQWNRLDDYVAHEIALSHIFRADEKFRLNTDLKYVIIKCSALNDFYSTNIYRIAPVARKITQIPDFDGRLAKGDVDLVEEIASVDGRRNYSFASKYCSHHQPELYPIYDRYVADVLVCLKKRFPDKLRFKDRNALKDYATFRNVIDMFMETFGLTEYTYKDVDQYLWQLGKDYYNHYK